MIDDTKGAGSSLEVGTLEQSRTMTDEGAPPPRPVVICGPSGVGESIPATGLLVYSAYLRLTALQRLVTCGILRIELWSLPHLDSPQAKGP